MIKYIKNTITIHNINLYKLKNWISGLVRKETQALDNLKHLKIPGAGY